MESEYKKKLQNIKAFVFDVDGVLTNGNLYIFPDGKLIRKMNAKDGYALKLAIKKKYIIGIITGGIEEEIKIRLEKLGVNEVILKSHNKLPDLEKIMTKYKLKKEEILYMGDDIPDLEVLQNVGFSSCPNDAVQEIKKHCDYVSNKNGGKGCVRDVIEQVLKVADKWDLDGQIKY
tara:strand:- start:385 stop:909 length:525 start_codon:yes stop_codon:yes gene_type:complete